jgi:hypothetical protein
MAFSVKGSNDETRCRERYEEGHKRKVKDTIIDDVNNKKTKVSCNYILYD